MDAADWCSLSLLGSRLDGTPMLELLLPENSERATAEVATTPGLHPGAGASQATGDRSHHGGHPLGEGQEILELLVGAAPSAWRGRSGGSDKEKVKENPIELDGPEHMQEEENFMEDYQEFSPELFGKKGSISPVKESPEKIKFEEKKAPSPPQSPLRFLLQPAMNMLARLTKGETDPFGEIKPLENKGFRRADLPKIPRGGRGRGKQEQSSCGNGKEIQRQEALRRGLPSQVGKGPKRIQEENCERASSNGPSSRRCQA